MYLYHFTQYAGSDRVFGYDEKISKAGDLLSLGEGNYGLVLGEEIAWKEKVPKNAVRRTQNQEVLIP